MKKCSKCKVEKPISNFSYKNKEKGILSHSCKKCHSEYSKKHYLNNINYYKKKAKISNSSSRERNMEYIIQYLQSHPCVDCGEKDIEVLEFDHIELVLGRGGRVTQMQHNSLSRLNKEIMKCEVRCGNCHTRRTRKQFGRERIK